MSSLTHNNSCRSLIEHQTEKEPKRQRLTPQQSKNNLNDSFDDSELQSIISEDLNKLMNSDEEDHKINKPGTNHFIPSYGPRSSGDKKEDKPFRKNSE